MSLRTAADRRTSERIVSRVDAEALVAGRLGRGIVSNLSVDGCRIETTNGFVAQGDPIILRLPGTIRVVGTVVWREGRAAGVKFRAPMHPAVVAHLGFSESPTGRNATVGRDLDGLPPGAQQWRAAVLCSTVEVCRFFA
jgi:hypothetical protein